MLIRFFCVLCFSFSFFYQRSKTSCLWQIDSKKSLKNCFSCKSKSRCTFIEHFHWWMAYVCGSGQYTKLVGDFLSCEEDEFKNTKFTARQPLIYLSTKLTDFCISCVTSPSPTIVLPLIYERIFFFSILIYTFLLKCLAIEFLRRFFKSANIRMGYQLENSKIWKYWAKTFYVLNKKLQGQVSFMMNKFSNQIFRNKKLLKVVRFIEKFSLRIFHTFLLVSTSIDFFFINFSIKS